MLFLLTGFGDWGIFLTTASYYKNPRTLPGSLFTGLLQITENIIGSSFRLQFLTFFSYF